MKQQEQQQTAQEKLEILKVSKAPQNVAVEQVEQIEKPAKKRKPSKLSFWFPEEFIKENKSRINHLYSYFKSQYDGKQGQKSYWGDREAMTAVIVSLMLNLSPLSGEVGFVRRWNKRDEQWIPSIHILPTYRGQIKILKNEGIIKSVEYEYVFYGDIFNINTFELRKNPVIRRIPENLQGIIIKAHLSNGEEFMLFVSEEEIEHRRQLNQAEQEGKHSAWKVDYLAMALAKALRILVKKLYLKLPYSEVLNQLDRFSDVNVLLNEKGNGFEYF